MKRPAVTQQQLVDCIRAYQHANTKEEMEAADATAVALIGPAPMESIPAKPRKRGKVARS